MIEVRVRDATPADAGFLAEMLAVAADWRSGTPVRDAAKVLTDPLLGRYVSGWPRPGDAGVVAEAGEVVAEAGRVAGAIGAAWWRFFTVENPGYGFVDAANPEVSIGVCEGWRGRGIGGRLLRALVSRAHAEGVPALSLSVERGNDAVRLYRRVGFETVEEDEGALTMVRRLSGGERGSGPGAG